MILGTIGIDFLSSPNFDMQEKGAWLLYQGIQNSNAENANENIDGLLAEAAYCMDNADSVLAQFEAVEAVA